MLHIIALVAIAAAPEAPQTDQIKLASTGFNAVNVNERLATFFSDHFAQQLVIEGFRVMTASEIAAIVGFERQKEMLGCTDGSHSCMTELANALGVDGLIVGSLAKFDTAYQVNVKVVGAQDGKPLAVFSGQAEGDKALLEKLNEAARGMSPVVKRQLGRSNVTAPDIAVRSEAPVRSGLTEVKSAPSGSEKKWPLVPTIIGGVLLAGGGTLLGISSAEGAKISDPAANSSLAEARQRAQTADQLRIGGYVGAGLGVVSLGVAATMYALSGSDENAVSVIPSASPNQAGAIVRGSF